MADQKSCAANELIAHPKYRTEYREQSLVSLKKSGRACASSQQQHRQDVARRYGGLLKMQSRTGRLRGGEGATRRAMMDLGMRICFVSSIPRSLAR